MSRPAPAGDRAVPAIDSELLELLVDALADRVADEVIRRMPRPVALAPAPAPPPAAPHPGPRLLRIGEVVQCTGLSKSTVYAMIRRKEFPEAVRLGTMTTWIESEVDGWISSRIAARDEAA